MQDKLPPLIREVERLVTAPYVPSLQDLYGVVHNVSFPVVCSWASCKPCQVEPLVDILVNALAYSNIALDLIRIFAPVAPFRNAVLERYPALLDQLLQKAEDEPKYSTTCTALLSSPLPADFTAPARLASFIMKLVNQMAERPSAETIRPIYKLMSGLQTSPRILYDIPLETMSILEGELRKVLRNIDDHMGNLLCLATFARLVSSQKLNYDSEHGPQVPTWLQNARHFFGPKRGLKTLDVVILHVILSCSADYNNMTAAEAAECVRLAIDICDCVEPGQKRVWCSGDLSNVAKLYEKVLRVGIAYEVQMMGIIFFISLLSVTGSCPKLCRLGLEGVLSKDSYLVMETIPLEFVPRLVDVSAVHMGKSAVRKWVSYLLGALGPHPTPEDSSSIPALKIASWVSHGLQKSESKFPGFMKEVTLVLKKGNVHKLIEGFPRKPLQSTCNQSNICYAALAMAENEFLVDLFNLQFCASVQQKGGNVGADKEDAGITSDFMARVKEGTCRSKCAPAAARPDDPRAKLSRFGTRDVSANSRRDWRLISNARASHDELVNKADNICHDPEHRRFNTEALVQATKEHDYVSCEPEQLHQLSSDLESQLQQAAGSNDGPNEQPLNTIIDPRNVSHHEQCAESTSARVEDLRASLDVAHRELEAQTQTLHRERETARTAELKFKATLTEKNNYFENLRRESSDQKANNEELQAKLVSMSDKNASLFNSQLLSERECSHLNRILEECREVTKVQANDIERLRDDLRSIESEKEDIEKKLLKEASGADRMNNALDDAQEQFRLDIVVLEKEHEAKLSGVNSELVKRREENEALQQSMQAAASDAAGELKTKDKRIRHLEGKIQSLYDERAAKAREFSIAQGHIGRLMDVMGFKSGPDMNAHSRSQSPLDDSQVATPFDETTQTQTDNLEDEDISTPSNVNDGHSHKGSITDKPWQKFRGTKPGETVGQKRKPTEELPRNWNTTKVRNRANAMSLSGRAVERAMNADKQAIRRMIVGLKATTAYKNASSNTQMEMAWEQEQKVMKRRDADGRSTKCIAREWGYGEEITELEFDDNSQSWEDEKVN